MAWREKFKAWQSKRGERSAVGWNGNAEAVQIAITAHHKLRGSLKPRDSVETSNLLAFLWGEDLVKLLFVYTTLTYREFTDSYRSHRKDQQALMALTETPLLQLRPMREAHFMQEFAEFVRQDQPHCPTTPQARYDAVVEGLRLSLRHNIQEVRQTNDIFPIDYLLDDLRIYGTLRAHMAHDVLCDVLIEMRRVMVTERDGVGIVPLEHLRSIIQDSLAFSVMQPEATPIFWQYLKTPAVSQVFWPVVDKIHYPNVTPYLVEALPFLSEEGKSHVIRRLCDMNDVRAIPVLQQIAADKTSPLSPLAAKAVARMLRYRRDDAALLLRPIEARHAGNVGDTLLRSVPAAPNTITHQDELLRATATNDQVATATGETEQT